MNINSRIFFQKIGKHISRSKLLWFNYFVMELMSFSSCIKILVQLTVLQIIIGDMKLKKYSIVLKDVIVGDVDKTYYFRSKIQCASKCQATSKCLSFAYNKQKQKCYLYATLFLNLDDQDPYPGLLTYTRHIDNVALTKPTASSSAINPSETSDKGVNGILYDKFQTLQNNPSWWCVDLQLNFDIHTIFIYNRLGKYANRMQYFELRLSSAAGCNAQNMYATRICYKNDGSVKHLYSISSCNQLLSGFHDVKTVFLYIYHNNLHAREIMIYAE